MTATAPPADRLGGSLQEKACALDDCSEPVTPHKGGSPKRFCSERCQRVAERRRYRARRTELAACKRPGCGRVFERSATSERKQVFCTLECQAAHRSVEYRARPDILAGIGAARRAAAPGSGHARAETALDTNALRRDDPADMN
jgi:predicted nucleic acid-binding Zn ribbon protein